MMIDKPNYPCENKGMAQWLNWIEQPPPKGQVAGSNPAWVTIRLGYLCSRCLGMGRGAVGFRSSGASFRYRPPARQDRAD